MSSSIKNTDSNKLKQGLLRSSITVGFMTILSRVLGLVRDVVIATYFGSKSEADAFFIAFKIPNLFRQLFGEGAFAQAFVPVLSEYRIKRSKEEVKTLVNHVAGTLGLILLGMSALCILASPLLIILFAPGFYQHANKLELAGSMLRITFPYLLLISLTAFAGSILNSCRRFAVPAFTPVLFNASLIGATIFMSPWFDQPVMALAWGVVIAGIAQLLLQLPFLWHIDMLPTPKWGWQNEGVKRILTLMLPALLSVSVAQINLLLDTVIASFLQAGSISWLYYSARLSELPLGIFGVAIATVILPSLSRNHAKEAPEAFSATLDWAIRIILLIGMPAGAALFILAEPLITTLFYHGQMTERDVMMSSMSLRSYAVGLMAFMLIKVLAPGYFAQQNMKTPVKIAITTMVVNMALNLILVWPLDHAGLALATSLSAWLNAGLLFLGLRKTTVYQPAKGWSMYGFRLMMANVVMVAALIWLCADPQQWLDWRLWSRIENLALLVVVGASIYFFTLLMLGMRIRHFRLN
ncbi:MAG: murein biosynthesis integral membrane protein MurJ [Endozoicomonadaceae bacterium]|nr:murein biosynthesis integral membrane protein MurJ [Endozoicomonadaceae bacterium]